MVGSGSSQKARLRTSPASAKNARLQAVPAPAKKRSALGSSGSVNLFAEIQDEMRWHAFFTRKQVRWAWYAAQIIAWRTRTARGSILLWSSTKTGCRILPSQKHLSMVQLSRKFFMLLGSKHYIFWTADFLPCVLHLSPPPPPPLFSLPYTICTCLSSLISFISSSLSESSDKW